VVLGWFGGVQVIFNACQAFFELDDAFADASADLRQTFAEDQECDEQDTQNFQGAQAKHNRYLH
jgi:hypothetical protein